MKNQPARCHMLHFAGLRFTTRGVELFWLAVELSFWVKGPAKVLAWKGDSIPLFLTLSICRPCPILPFHRPVPKNGLPKRITQDSPSEVLHPASGRSCSTLQSLGPADGSFCRLHFGLARQAVEIVNVGAALIEIEKQLISNATFIAQGGRTLRELMLHNFFGCMMNPMCIIVTFKYCEF